MVAPISKKASPRSSANVHPCGAENEDRNEEELAGLQRDCHVPCCCSSRGPAVEPGAARRGAGLLANRACEAKWPAGACVVGGSGNFCSNAEHTGAAQCALALCSARSRA